MPRVPAYGVGTPFDYEGRLVAQLGVKLLVLEAPDPRAGSDLEIVETAPRPAVVGESWRGCDELGLEGAMASSAPELSLSAIVPVEVRHRSSRCSLQVVDVQ